MFDKLYAVTQGNCIYQGPTKELVPFMKDNGLECPSYHNPADFRKSIFNSILYAKNHKSQSQNPSSVNWLVLYRFCFFFFLCLQLLKFHMANIM